MAVFLDNYLMKFWWKSPVVPTIASLILWFELVTLENYNLQKKTKRILYKKERKYWSIFFRTKSFLVTKVAISFYNLTFMDVRNKQGIKNGHCFFRYYYRHNVKMAFLELLVFCNFSLSLHFFLKNEIFSVIFSRLKSF